MMCVRLYNKSTVLFFAFLFCIGCKTTHPNDTSDQAVDNASTAYPPTHYQVIIKTTVLLGGASSEEIKALVRRQFLPLENTIIEEVWSPSGYDKITLTSMDGIDQFRISNQGGSIAGIRQYIGTTWAWHRWQSETQKTDGSGSSLTTAKQMTDGRITVERVNKNSAGAPSSLVTEKYEPISKIQFQNQSPTAAD